MTDPQPSLDVAQALAQAIENNRLRDGAQEHRDE